MKKSILIITLCIFCLLAFSSCGEPQSKFIGKWNCDKSITWFTDPTTGEKVYGSELYCDGDWIEFSPDGSAELYLNLCSYSGKWEEVTSDEAKVKLQNPSGIIYNLSEEEQVYYDADTDTIFMTVLTSGAVLADLSFERAE